MPRFGRFRTSIGLEQTIGIKSQFQATLAVQNCHVRRMLTAPLDGGRINSRSPCSSGLRRH
jgi:hypothetical protein